MIRFLAFGFVGLVLLVSCGDDLHSSNACTGDTDCALGAICTGGSCVPGCDDTHGCADALSCCSGVCIDVSSDVANCGACGSACSSENIATPTCSASVCNGECNVGTADCNGDKRTDGCETATTADGNCGACGATCNDTSCSTGVCLVQGGNGSCVAVDQSACATPACVLAQAGDCSAVDTDGDGLSDTWEKNGYIDMNCNGVNDAGDIQLLGADPAVRDIYVRYDYMATATHSHEPPPAALAQVAAAFATHQIHLHWLAPAGPLPGPDGMNSEYAVVSLDSSASTACAGSNFVTTATLRQNFFCNPANGGYPCSTGLQNPAYHYLVFGHDSTTPNSGVLAGACPSDPLCGGRPSAGSTGVSDVGGDDFIVSFGAYVDSGTQIGIELWAATTLHELGHNLTLVHGSLADAGDSAQACSVDKPNYVSVMNYAYQLGPIIPATAVGGDTPIDCTTDSDCGPPTQSSGVCATADACYCTDDLASFGGNICYRVDYSDQQYIDLTENQLNEQIGVGSSNPAGRDIVLFFDATGNEYVGASNGAGIDWDHNGVIDSGLVSADIDHTGTTSDFLDTSTDWDKLNLAFQCLPGYGAASTGAAPNGEVTLRDTLLHREKRKRARAASHALH